MGKTWRRQDAHGGGSSKGGGSTKEHWVKQNRVPFSAPAGEAPKKVKEYISVMLVRAGDNVAAVNHNPFLIDGEKVFQDLITRACGELGYPTNYPLYLTVGSRRTVPAAGTTMSLLYQTHMCKDDCLLYATYG